MISILILIFFLFSISAQCISLDQAYFQLAQAVKEAHNDQDFIVYLEKTVACNPNHAQAHFELGTHYYKHGALDKAYHYLQVACTLDCQNFQAFTYASSCALRLQQIDSAIEYAQQANKINPSSPASHFLLGSAYIKKKNLYGAIDEFNKTLHLNPQSIDVHICLANALRDTHQFITCFEHYEKALSFDPTNQNILFEKAQALALQGDILKACALYQELYKKNSSSPILMYNLAHLYKKMGEYDRAIELYTQILKSSPNFHQAHLGLAQAYLFGHNFYDGFKELALSVKNHITEKPLLTKLSDACNKTILITASWDSQDMIQLLPFLSLLKKIGARVIVQSEANLSPLLQLCPFIDQVITLESNTMAQFDMYISLLALPALCITQENKLTVFESYLKVPHDLMDKWRSKIQSNVHINIGIYWQCPDQQSNKSEDKNLPLKLFAQLMQESKVRCYGLQFPTAQDLEHLCPMSMFTILNKSMTPEKDILQFCSLLSALDIIITCDSLVAHLAGALGKPTILILPEISQWRWIRQENKSCFYPSITIICAINNDYDTIASQINECVGKYSRTHNYDNIV